MQRRENHLPLIRAAFLLTIALVITFQFYQLREPSRLNADAATDKHEAEEAGGLLYSVNCASCHGNNGEGVVAPALNSKSLLADVSDDQLFGLTRTGVPGTGMPAWSQDFGGPLTDEHVRELVAFIRSWEPGLEATGPSEPLANPTQGAELFETICAVCHGSNGIGTDRAPSLNNDELLSDFDDSWFKETIIQGRPSKGMPTWGTVLSPAQIGDVVALIAAWREGEQFEVGSGDETSVEDIYVTYCAACHGDEGQGGFGPPLRESENVGSESDQALLNLILNGRSGTAMPGFLGQLSESESSALVELLRGWQP
jgi:mono/diheme cytochrome c family protein